MLGPNAGLPSNWQTSRVKDLVLSLVLSDPKYAVCMASLPRLKVVQSVHGAPNSGEFTVATGLIRSRRIIVSRLHLEIRVEWNTETHIASYCTQAIASAAHIAVLDERLNLLSTLPFSDAFPLGGFQTVTAVSVESDEDWVRFQRPLPKSICISSACFLGQLVAACGQHVAIWHQTSSMNWRIHSSLTVGHIVTSIDLQSS